MCKQPWADGAWRGRAGPLGVLVENLEVPALRSSSGRFLWRLDETCAAYIRDVTILSSSVRMERGAREGYGPHMRARTAALASTLAGLLGCGTVKNSPVDAGHDTGSGPNDGSPDGATVDAPPADGPATPTARLHWTFDGNTNNTGSVNGFAFATPAGISYANGKVGMAASFGSAQYATVTGMRQVLGAYAKVTIAFWLMEPGTLSSNAVFDCNNRSTAPYGGVQLGLFQSGGQNTTSLCVSTTSASFLGGGCGGFAAPSANSWHHWILRYDGTGTGTGQGGRLEVYVDGALVHTRANDAANDPVFNTTGMNDTLYLGAPGTLVDDLQVHDRVFTAAEQCTQLVGGTVGSAGCVLP